MATIRFGAFVAFVAFDLVGGAIVFARSATERTRRDLKMRAIAFLRWTRIGNFSAIPQWSIDFQNVNPFITAVRSARAQPQKVTMPAPRVVANAELGFVSERSRAGT